MKKAQMKRQYKQKLSTNSLTPKSNHAIMLSSNDTATKRKTNNKGFGGHTPNFMLVSVFKKTT